MEIREFVKNVLLDLVSAVDEASDDSVREIWLCGKKDEQEVEFDIAVTAESSGKKSGKGGIHVLSFAEAGGRFSKSSKNKTVSRIKFSVKVSDYTKEQGVPQLKAY